MSRPLKKDTGPSRFLAIKIQDVRTNYFVIFEDGLVK
jgi:hypothetical protein